LSFVKQLAYFQVYHDIGFLTWGNFYLPIKLKLGYFKKNILTSFSKLSRFCFFKVNFDSKLIGVRYFTVYGPRQRPDMAFTRICSSLLSNDVFPIYGTGQQIRDFTYVSDAVKATVLLMDQKVTGIFNIGGGEETTLLNAIGLFEGISGKKLNVTTEYSAKGDVEKTGASTLKLTQLTGWTPKFNMVSGIEAQWNWALKNKLAIIESVREFRDI